MKLFVSINDSDTASTPSPLPFLPKFEPWILRRWSEKKWVLGEDLKSLFAYFRKQNMTLKVKFLRFLFSFVTYQFR